MIKAPSPDQLGGDHPALAPVVPAVAYSTSARAARALYERQARTRVLAAQVLRQVLVAGSMPTRPVVFQFEASTAFQMVASGVPCEALESRLKEAIDELESEATALSDILSASE